MDKVKAKAFWKYITQKIGAIDPKIIYLFTANGFNSLMSFKGHYLRNLPEQEIIDSFQDFVRELPDTSPQLDFLGLNVQNKNEFKLAQGEIGTILGVIEEMKEICKQPNPFPQLPQSSSSQPRLTVRAIEITAANAATETQKAIRRRLKGLIAFEDDDVIIIRSRTDKFPYSLEVKCINCSKSFFVTISKDKNFDQKFNIQSQKYTKHVKSCNAND